jgi:hypothetical protein
LCSINYYSPTVFKSIGITGTNTGFFTTGLFGVVKTVVTVVWLLYLIDHLGRTKLLMFGAAGGSVCMWIIGAYIKLHGTSANGDKLPPGGIAAIFFFYLWTFFYTPSWNGTPWVINSEMFSQQTRSLGQASAAANNWSVISSTMKRTNTDKHRFWNFIISRFTPQMFLTMSYGVYFFFASLMILSIPFVFFLIPETKGIPLFEIKPIHKAHPVMLERLKEMEQVREGGIYEEKAKDYERRENV